MGFRLVAALSVALAAAAAHAGDWPQFGRTPQHVNTNPTETAFSAANIGSLAILWKGHFGDNTVTEGGAVIAGNRLFVTGFDGKLSAFDLAGCGAASCEPLWQGATRNDITATPAVADGRVYIASADRFLHVFDAAGCGAAQCSPLWRGRLQDAAIDSSVAVINGRAYVGDYGGRLYAFDAAGCGATLCSPLWTAQGTANEQFVSTPTVDDTHLFLQTTISTPDDVTGRLLAFNLADCTGATCAPAWSADLGGPAGRTSAPLVANGKVYVGSAKRFGGPNGSDHLFAFDAAGCGAPTCEPVTTFEAGIEGVDTALALDGTTLYIGTIMSPRANSVGVIAAFDVNCRRRCRAKWTGINFTDGAVSPPVVANGLVFAGKGPAEQVDSGVFVYKAGGCGRVVCQALKLVLAGPTQFYLGAPLAIGNGRIAFVSNDNSDGHSNLLVLGVP